MRAAYLLVALLPLGGCAEMFQAFVRNSPGGYEYARAAEEQRRWENHYEQQIKAEQARANREALWNQRAYLAAVRAETSDPIYANSLDEHIAAIDRLLAGR